MPLSYSAWIALSSFPSSLYSSSTIHSFSYSHYHKSFPGLVNTSSSSPEAYLFIHHFVHCLYLHPLIQNPRKHLPHNTQHTYFSGIVHTILLPFLCMGTMAAFFHTYSPHHIEELCQPLHHNFTSSFQHLQHDTTHTRHLPPYQYSHAPSNSHLLLHYL